MHHTKNIAIYHWDFVKIHMSLVVDFELYHRQIGGVINWEVNQGMDWSIVEPPIMMEVHVV